MISSLTRHAKETASHDTLRWDNKMEYVSKLDFCKYYSLYGNMWKLILQSQTLSSCSKSSMKYLEEEPALQCRRQFVRWTRRH